MFVEINRIRLYLQRFNDEQYEKSYGKYMLVAPLTTPKVVREQFHVYTSYI